MSIPPLTDNHYSKALHGRDSYYDSILQYWYWRLTWDWKKLCMLCPLWFRDKKQVKGDIGQNVHTALFQTMFFPCRKNILKRFKMPQHCHIELSLTKHLAFSRHFQIKFRFVHILTLFGKVSLGLTLVLPKCHWFLVSHNQSQWGNIKYASCMWDLKIMAYILNYKQLTLRY